jgi:hypothetical protein
MYCQSLMRIAASAIRFFARPLGGAVLAHPQVWNVMSMPDFAIDGR